MRRFLVLFALLFIVLAHPARADYETFLEHYEGLLDSYVIADEKEGIKSTLVDYEGWALDKRHALARESAQNSITPSTYMGALAYWINLYNFFVIDVVVQNVGDIDTIQYAGPVFSSPWRHYSWRVAGQAVNLDHIENDLLKGTGEGYVAMAITKAALSSPDLREEPYSEEKLKEQLYDQTVTFLTNSGKGMSRAENGGTLISKVFQDYETIFGGPEKVYNFISAHLAPEVRPRRIRGFMTFNWDLNSLSQ